MPDFNIHLVDYVSGTRPDTGFGTPNKDFIQAGLLRLFQDVVTQGKSRADAVRRRRHQPEDSPVYNIIVNWVNQPPASSGDYICYFVRSRVNSIISRLGGGNPESQGLTWALHSQSISEVYAVRQGDLSRLLPNAHLVQVVFHEFLHNRLEMPTHRGRIHHIHASDPTGFGATGTRASMIRDEDDPATIGIDERYRIETGSGHLIVLTPEFDIDLVYASLANPVPQYIQLRPDGTAPASP